jgi:hypothetical protein
LTYIFTSPQTEARRAARRLTHMEPGWYHTRRFVLAPGTGVADVAAFVESQGWEKTEEGPADSTAGIGPWAIWRAPDGVEMHFVEDAIFHQGYYVLTGPKPELVDAMAAQAEDVLEPWDIDELVELHDEAEDDKRKTTSAMLLALSSGPAFDERIYTRLLGLLEDPDVSVRGVGVSAALYARYPQLRAVLEAIAEGDQATDLRVRARTILEDFDSDESQEQP